MLIGQAINVFVPARLGDIVRSTMVETESTAYVLGTQFLRLALDTIMLAVLVIFLLFQVSLPQWWRGPGEALVVTSILVLLAVAGLIAGRRYLERLLVWLQQRWPFAWGRRFLGIAASFLYSVEVFSNPLIISVLAALTILIWVVYALVNYVLLAAVGIPPSWLAALFLLVVLLLGVAVPSSPGRVGVYHYLAVQALAVFGVDQSTALSFAIIQHLISVILPAVIGALLIWHSGLGTRVLSPREEG